MPMSENRTKWPVTGGAVGFQPGWFQGHVSALMYINLGEGTVPGNYSLVMQPQFGISGPTNQMYNGSVCFPQVPLPANFTAEIGKNATIQIVEAAQHGAALYNVSHPEARARDPLVGGGLADDVFLQCVDITFADPKDVPEVTPDNCANTSNIAFDFVYSTASLTSDSPSRSSRLSWMASIPLAAAFAWMVV